MSRDEVIKPYAWLDVTEDGAFYLRWDSDDQEPLYRESALEMIEELKSAIPMLLTRAQYDVAGSLNRFAYGMKRWRAEYVDTFGAKVHVGAVTRDASGFVSFKMTREP